MGILDSTQCTVTLATTLPGFLHLEAEMAKKNKTKADLAKDKYQEKLLREEYDKEQEREEYWRQLRERNSNLPEDSPSDWPRASSYNSGDSGY